MFYPTSTAEFDDYMKLLAVKRKPNRKESALSGLSLVMKNGIGEKIRSS